VLPKKLGKSPISDYLLTTAWLAQTQSIAFLVNTLKVTNPPYSVVQISRSKKNRDPSFPRGAWEREENICFGMAQI